MSDIRARNRAAMVAAARSRMHMALRARKAGKLFEADYHAAKAWEYLDDARRYSVAPVNADVEVIIVPKRRVAA